LDQATVGIENAEGTDGAQVAFNTPYVRDGLAVRFIPPSVANVNIISAISSTSGVVPAGGSRTLAVTLDPMDLPSGIYADQLTVSSNAPDKSNSTVDIELTVNDVLEVTGFTLINADTDAEIGPLNEGDIINISEIGTRNFNVVAAINDVEIGSVVFDFNETIAFSTENVAPYALGGDRSGDFRPLSFDIGANTITATPFSESRGGGDAGISNTVNFEVISGTETLNLVNANTNEIISSLSDGDIIDLNDFPSTTELSILAETEIANIGSILFDFNGESAFQIENLAPYALNGGSLNTSNPVAFIPGINTVTANVHSGRRGGGSILGSISISFEVIPVTGGTELIGTKVYPNPITSNTSFITIENNTKQNLNSTLYNVLGQIVYSGKDFDINAQGNAVLKTIELPIGAYILRLTDDTGTIVSQLKLIKQ